MKPQEDRLSAERMAERMAEIFKLPKNLGWEDQETFGHRPGPGCSQRSSLDDLLLLHPDLTETASEPLGTRGGSAALIKNRVTTVVTFGKDGAVKIVKRGHELVENDLWDLGDEPLAKAIRDYAAAGQSLAAKAEEKTKLANELLNLTRFVAYEPTLISHDIKRAFPEVTAGQNVDMIHVQTTNVGDCPEYQLTVNGTPDRTIGVTREFGQDIMNRKQSLKQVQEDITAKTDRHEELGRNLADLRQTLPLLWQKVQHLCQNLDPAQLKRQLGGDLMGFTLDDQNKPVLLVRREVNEELAEIPDEDKRQLIAQHLAGRELPTNIQKALGIDGAIKAVTKAISAPKTAPKPAAKTKTAAR